MSAHAVKNGHAAAHPLPFLLGAGGEVEIGSDTRGRVDEAAS